MEQDLWQRQATAGIGLAEAQQSGDFAPAVTGIGLMVDEVGVEYIEVRVEPGVRTAALHRNLASSYNLPVSVLRVVSAPSAQAQFAIRAGDGLGHAGCGCVGTAGAFLIAKQSGEVYVLSNAHVLARDGHANIGDWIVDENGIGVARLTRSVKLIPGSTYVADAAIAHLVPGVQAHVGSYLSPAIAQAGDYVWKDGRTTGRTFGRVASVNYSLWVPMRFGKVRFQRQIVIAPERGKRFSDHGDSGSAIRDSGLETFMTGLLFAGDDTPPFYTYANHATAALGSLGLPISQFVS